ncbi:Ig-like domain-containing protein [Epilithonimonas sp. JDS]|uniref:Ig-like domain-containing protein n=1 Tax=Epilithonimonas sp. JDS TaxID=2902797 RepID=UPI001E41D46E|nr:Ig-like domain-containing protein [Epilithonimonas sp. JDS]MCD9853265.1 Ig-like domain-containing protein [Epilithonimonas sp. JDS]
MKKSLLFFSSLLCLLLFNNARAQVWESVGSSAGISAGNAGRLTMVNDFQDNLYVGYYDAAALKGSVQKFNGTSWSYVGNQGMTTTTAGYNSLSVNNQGVPYFLNQAATAPEVGHQARVFENNTWTSLPNVTNAVINYNSSTISANNTLFAVNNEANGTVKKFVNGAWVQVGNTGFAGGLPAFVDMVSTTDGKIYVSFNTAGYLHVYVNDQNATATDAWQPAGGVADLASSPNNDEYYSSLATDSNNNVYVAYASSTAGGNKLNVKKFNGTTWSQVGPLNFSPGRTKYASIAIGANNKIYVAVSNWENADTLRNYVMGYDETTNTWNQVGTGYASQGQGLFNSLAVTSNGDLYLAYVDSVLQKLCVKKLNLAVVAPTSLEVTTQNNAPAAIGVDKGTLQLNAVVNPSTASQDVVWSVEEGSTFATVSQTGLVTAIASNAVVKIKATSALNFAVFDEIDVTITNQNSPVAAASVKVSTLNDAPKEIYSIGGTLQLTSKTLPVEADQYVNWSVTQGANVASVDATGKVTGLGEGFAIIRATDTKSALYGEIRIDVFKNGCRQAVNTNFFGSGLTITKNVRKGADDFIVPAGTKFEVTKIRLNVISSETSPLGSFDIKFLDTRNNGQPGKEIASVLNVVPTSQKYLKEYIAGLAHYEVELYFSQPIAFNEGTYWLSPSATGQDGSSVFWDATVDEELGSDYYQDRLDGNGWVIANDGGFNGAFAIVGNCMPMPLTVGAVQGQNTQILIGQTVQLEAKLNGNITTNVNWSVVDGNSFISLDSNGLVTGIASGIAKVKVTNPVDGSFATSMVYVTDPNACGQEVPSNDKEEGWIGVAAVDIEVPVGTKFTIKSVLPTTVNFATSFSFKFYKDDNGQPGEELLAVGSSIVEDTTGTQWSPLPYWAHKYEVKLNQEVVLEAGKYWMSMESDAIGWEASTSGVVGEPMMLFEEGAWNPSPTGSDFVYELKGTCTASELGTSEVSNKDFKFYPNPVKDVLNFDSTKKVESIEIYGMAGQKVKQLKPNMTNGQVSTDKLPTGVYIFKASLEDGTTKSFRVIKK